MRKFVYALSYVAAVVFGILLLIFNHQAMVPDDRILRSVILGAGILFIIPGLLLLIASLKPKKNENGEIVAKPWYPTAIAITSLIWGLMMICMPKGFIGNLNITLGVSLIIVSLAQLLWIIRDRKINGAPFWLYIIPCVMICVGIIVILIPHDFQNPGQDMATGCIISGIAYVLWAANGFMALPKRIKKSDTEIANVDNSEKTEKVGYKEDVNKEDKNEKIERLENALEKDSLE